MAGIKTAGRNTSNFRYADDNTLMVESEDELNSLLMKVKEESERAGLKSHIQKTKIMASGPSIYGKKLGKREWQVLFSWAPESLWMVTAATNLKNACFLEEKLWQT